jgi:hypothetical protein
MSDAKLEPLFNLADSIGSRIDAAVESLSSLPESQLPESDADKIRTAVLSIQAGNNLVSAALGTEQHSISVPVYSLANDTDTKSEPVKQESPGERVRPEMELVSATLNLKRLVFIQGPQRVSDTISAGLAADVNEAIEIMTRLVDHHDARWTTIADEQAIVAVR